MPIQTLNDYLSAAKQNIPWTKTASRTTIAAAWFSLFDIAGNPGAGTLPGANTANGVVPDDTVQGFPAINAFGAAATGHLSRFEFSNSVASRVALYDCVFKAGAYAFNANVNLSAQPDFSSRVPDGNYGALELWIETATAFTGNLSVTVGYNDGAAAAQSTGVFAPGVAPTIGRCFQLPFAAASAQGISRLNSVVATTATVGTFNVLVLRPLISARIPVAGGGDVFDFLRTGNPVMYSNSALYGMIAADSTSSGVPELQIEVANI